MMHTTLNQYIYDDQAQGFVVDFADFKYSFAAIMPNEGISVKDYVASLSGSHLQELLQKAQKHTVFSALPEFEVQFQTELSNQLKEMGMTDAFDSSMGNFSEMVTDSTVPIYIGSIQHKTFLNIGPDGARGGAGSAVEMAAGGFPQNPVTVHLTRLFIYVVYDRETKVPIFLGTLMSTK